jgi:hypothetical protein
VNLWARTGLKDIHSDKAKGALHEAHVGI